MLMRTAREMYREATPDGKTSIENSYSFENKGKFQHVAIATAKFRISEP